MAGTPTDTRTTPHRIVILGAGFGRHVERLARSDLGVEITLDLAVKKRAKEDAARHARAAT